MRSVGLDVHQKYTCYTEVDNGEWYQLRLVPGWSARPDSYESID